MVLIDKRKITAIMALLAACTFCVAGCHKSQDNGASGESVKEAVSDMGQAGSGQEGTQQESTEQEEDVVYQPSFKEWEVQAQYTFMGAVPYLSSFMDDDTLWGIGNFYNEGKKKDEIYLAGIDLETGVLTERALDLEAQGGLDFYEVNGGYLAYAETEKMLYVYDSEFELEKELDMRSVYDSLKNEGRTLSCEDVVVDAEGNICLLSNNVFVVLDGEGKFLRTIECPADLGIANIVLFATASGECYAFGCINGMSALTAYEVDTKGGKATKCLSDTSAIVYSIYSVEQANENMLYILTDNYVLEYNIQTSKVREIFCLLDYGIQAEQYCTVFHAKETGGFCIANFSEQGDVNDEGCRSFTVEVADSAEMHADEVQPRRELVMAVMNTPTLKDRAAIERFNKYNMEWYVKIKSYESNDEDYDTCLMNFYNDLVTGNGADIFLIPEYGGIDIANLGEKGILVDLYELMRNDDELNAEDFVPSVLSGMESDGRLYGISPDFNLFTLVVKKSIFEKYDSWDYGTICDMLAQYPDSELLVNTARDIQFDFFTKFSMDLFYDEDTGEYDFTSEQFIKLLEAVRSIEPEYSVCNGTLKQELDADKVLMYQCMPLRISDIKWVDIYFGDEDRVYAGYPSRSPGAQLSFSYSIAINKQSENCEAAWEFVKEYIVNYEAYGYSVLSEKLDAMIEQEMTECLSYDSNIYGDMMEGKILTEEQAQTFYDILASAQVSKGFSTDIYNIIYEEAQAYFAGTKNARDVAAILQDRVQIYVDERK